MSLEEHISKFPAWMEDYFSSRFDRQAIWKMELSISSIDTSEFDWMLELPFWSTSPPRPLFDLKPIDVLQDRLTYSVHWNRSLAADLSHPIDVGEFQGRRIILDGLHRLLKLKHLGRTNVAIRLVPKSAIQRAA